MNHSVAYIHATEPGTRPTAAVMAAKPDGTPEYIVARIEPSSIRALAFAEGTVVEQFDHTDHPSVSVFLSIENAKALHRMLACCLAKPGDSCPQCDGTGEGPDRPHTWSSGLTEDVPSECWDCAGQGVVQLVEGERDPAPPVLTMEDAIRMMSA